MPQPRRRCSAFGVRVKPLNPERQQCDCVELVYQSRSFDCCSAALGDEFFQVTHAPLDESLRHADICEPKCLPISDEQIDGGFRTLR